MAKAYSWEDSGTEAGVLPRSGNVGYGFAVLVSVVVGVSLFAGLLMGLGELRLLLGLATPIEIRSDSFNLQQVEVSSTPLPEVEDEVLIPETTQTSDLLTDIEELIPELDNSELDISPEINQPALGLEASIPLDSGEDFGELLEPVAAPKVDHVLDQIGRSENLFEEAAAGQVMIEEGSVKADLVDPDELLKDMAKKGSGGLSEEGLPSGYASIDGLLQMQTSELTRSRAALPSDLLFEYDSAQLRETARLGLMKLAMLIDRNPEMFCILEGHTDLFGGEAYNLSLSQQRAAAVKNWLTESMRLQGDRIIVRAYGMTQPKVLSGSIDEQALNRRVDILMRRDAPTGVTAPPVEQAPAVARPIPVQPIPNDEGYQEIPTLPNTAANERASQGEKVPLRLPDGTGNGGTQPPPPPLRPLQRTEGERPIRPLQQQPQEVQEPQKRTPLRALPVPTEGDREPQDPEVPVDEPRRPLRAIPVPE